MARTSKYIQTTASSASEFQSLLFLCLTATPGLYPPSAGRSFGVGSHGEPLQTTPTYPFSFCCKAHELDQKIQDVYKRMQTERKLLEASKLLSQATTNPDVLRQNDAKIREAERSLSYFEDTLRELQARKMMQVQRDDQSRSGSPGPSHVGGSYRQCSECQSNSNRIS